MQNLDLRSESIKERARGEALQQAFPTSRPQAINRAATQGAAPAALKSKSNEMFSTAFDASQAARQGTNVEGHAAAPMVAAHDDRGVLGERGGPRVPSRPIPPTPMSEPIVAFHPKQQDDDEVSYDDGTHLTLASEAGSQDTSEDDRFACTPHLPPESRETFLRMIPSLDPQGLLPSLAFLGFFGYLQTVDKREKWRVPLLHLVWGRGFGVLKVGV